MLVRSSCLVADVEDNDGNGIKESDEISYVMECGTRPFRFRPPIILNARARRQVFSCSAPCIVQLAL